MCARASTTAVDDDQDGVADGCDLCPDWDDLADDDQDSVPDGCDVCAEGDDLADEDGDEVPDGMRPVCWRCTTRTTPIEDGLADACDPCPGFNAVESYDPVEPAVSDVLFVVDDSVGMAGEQAALAAGLDALRHPDERSRLAGRGDHHQQPGLSSAHPSSAATPTALAEPHERRCRWAPQASATTGGSGQPTTRHCLEATRRLEQASGVPRRCCLWSSSRHWQTGARPLPRPPTMPGSPTRAEMTRWSLSTPSSAIYRMGAPAWMRVPDMTPSSTWPVASSDRSATPDRFG